MPTLILTGDQFLMSVRDMYVERLSLWTSKEFGLMFQVTMVIISFLTNILVDLLSEDCNDGDIQQVLSEVMSGGSGVFDFCNTFPAIRIFLALPNVRLRPQWYSQHRSSILRSLHQFMESAPLNLQILEDFAGDIERDQVHFSVLSGILYVKHLVDRSMELFSLPVPDKHIR